MIFSRLQPLSSVVELTGRVKNILYKSDRLGRPSDTCLSIKNGSTSSSRVARGCAARSGSRKFRPLSENSDFDELFCSNSLFQGPLCPSSRLLLDPLSVIAYFV